MDATGKEWHQHFSVKQDGNWPLSPDKLLLIEPAVGCEVCERLRETEQQSDNFPTSQLPGLTGGADDAEANKSWEISLLDQTGGFIKVKCEEGHPLTTKRESFTIL